MRKIKSFLNIKARRQVRVEAEQTNMNRKLELFVPFNLHVVLLRFTAWPQFFSVRLPAEGLSLQPTPQASQRSCQHLTASRSYVGPGMLSSEKLQQQVNTVLRESSPLRDATGGSAWHSETLPGIGPDTRTAGTECVSQSSSSLTLHLAHNTTVCKQSVVIC